MTHIYNPGTSEDEAGWSPWCEDSLGSHSKLLDSLDQSKTARKDGDHSSKLHGSSLLLCMSTRLFSVFLQSHVQYNWCSDISQRHRREKNILRDNSEWGKGEALGRAEDPERGWRAEHPDTQWTHRLSPGLLPFTLHVSCHLALAFSHPCSFPVFYEYVLKIFVDDMYKQFSKWWKCY